MGEQLTVRRLSQISRKVNLPGTAFVTALVIVWQAIVGSGLVTYDYLPSPRTVVNAGFDLISAGTMTADIRHTLTSTMVGWIIGAGIGMSVGLLLALVPVVWRNSMASLEVLRALPAIAFVPAAVLIFGFSMKMEIIVVSYVAIWPVLINTLDGARGVSALHVDVANILRLSTAQRVWKVVLPTATSSIIVGLRLSLALSLALAVVAEMIGNPAGVGYALVMQQQALEPANVFAYIVVIGLLGIALNACFMALARLLFPGPVSLISEVEG
jgi:NitT/TauT family transport system permease protein